MTSCGLLETSINHTKTGTLADGATDIVNIDFIEFNNGVLMIGDEIFPPNIGGAPDVGMPMRQETFYYPQNKKIDDIERIV